MLYKVSDVSRISGVSVRALHHYDAIGLLKPANVNEAGYRFYSDRDLERLQLILFYRTLEFGLEDIRGLLDRASGDKRRVLAVLKAQRKLLAEKKMGLERAIRTIDRTIAARTKEKPMAKEKMFEGFDRKALEAHQTEYEGEAEKLYGRTEAWKESQRRTKAYTKEDWARVLGRGSEIFARIGTMMDRPVTDPEVQKEVGEWRSHISESFYDCTLEIFRGLGEMYVADARFTKNIDRIRPGLSRYLSEAIRAYCDRKER
jgi:DNA-binding transcriptional MerR regulator